MSNNIIIRTKDFLKTRTGHLALTYFAIIMAMTIVFSVVIFAIASNQFDRPLQPRTTFRSVLGGDDTYVRDLLDQRADEARMGLLVGLLILNTGMALFGVWFSVYLARRTMEPIEQAMEEQGRFVSDASHELRTPLTALQAMNEVALRRKKITDAEARELAQANVTEATKLHALTTSLLGLVTSDRAPVTLKPVDIQAAVADAMSYVVGAAQAKHIEVEDKLPAIRITTDSEKLVHVVRILLDNAVKYSNKNGKVVIAAKELPHMVRLSVTDNGVGIQAADIPHIFSRFYRADASRSKEQHEGYGLGLAIAKTISDRMGWKISATSKFGSGSTFSIDMPVGRN